MSCVDEWTIPDVFIGYLRIFLNCLDATMPFVRPYTIYISSIYSRHIALNASVASFDMTSSECGHHAGMHEIPKLRQCV